MILEMTNTPFSQILSGGDCRSISNANEVVTIVKAQPERWNELWTCLFSNNPIIQIHAADALEKISRKNNVYLTPYKDALLQIRLMKSLRNYIGISL